MNLEAINSPHQSSRNGKKPELIVCHIADGTYEGTKAWFQNKSAATSSHFIVGKLGQVCQCVPLDHMAWCNGTSTDKTDSRYFGHSTVPLVQQRGGNANEYSVSIECEGYYKDAQGALTIPQLHALAELIVYIKTEVKRLYGADIPLTRERVVGHYEITPKTRANCPGQAFPWGELMQMISPALTERLYRVQVGAFSSKANAEALQKKLKAAGYDGIIV